MMVIDVRFWREPDVQQPTPVCWRDRHMQHIARNFLEWPAPLICPDGLFSDSGVQHFEDTMVSGAVLIL
jgi:hypothetical protein